MDYDDLASAIDGGAIIATQPVSPLLTPFALNPAHAVQGMINFAKSDNVNLHRKGTSRLNNDPLIAFPKTSTSSSRHFLIALRNSSGIMTQWG